MITYLYWICSFLLTGLVFWLVGRFVKWKYGAAAALFTLFVAWSAYNYKYEQVFVKNYGGVMSIRVPEGQHHISVTWKDENLWVENYDPKTNRCFFSEYSKGDILQGQVTIENCNPLMPAKQ
jgi:hypothetical protein